MKKSFRNLFNKKGLTLVEILVVFIVSSILIGIAMGMLAPVRNLMNAIKSNAHLDAVCDTANEYIRGRLQSALSVTMMKAETDDDINNIGIVAQEYTDKSDSDKTVLKALAILGEKDPDDSSNTLYRLYDFGTVTNGGMSSGDVVQIGELKSYIKNPSTAYNKYSAFMNAFYENTSYSVKFSWGTHDSEAVTDDDGTYTPSSSVTDWLKITSTCYRYGEQANQERQLSFKIFGGTAEFDSSEAGDGSGAMVILYTVKDFDKYLSPTT